ncbi:GFRA [Mytilus coruscus]|uniref:GFRA n=1 Tax=Mytilus coruscus TaxID=42192 RepID=A0A6J8BSW9_MYTCO|nr:GFRA [Mytilus coruscus]
MTRHDIDGVCQTDHLCRINFIGLTHGPVHVSSHKFPQLQGKVPPVQTRLVPLPVPRPFPIERGTIFLVKDDGFDDVFGEGFGDVFGGGFDDVFGGEFESLLSLLLIPFLLMTMMTLGLDTTRNADTAAAPATATTAAETTTVPATTAAPTTTATPTTAPSTTTVAQNGS